MTDVRTRLVRSIFYNYLARILPFPAILVINIGLARLFGAEVLGQVALLLLVTTVLSYASRLTTGVGLVHALAAYPPDSRATWRFVARTAVRSVPIMAVATLLVGLGGSILLDRAYGQRQLWPALWLLIFVFAVFEHGWGLAQSCFRAIQKMQLFVRAETAAQYLTLAFLFSLPLWAGRTAFSASLYRAFFAITAFAFGLWLMIREYRRSRPGEVASEVPVSHVISYGLRAMPHQLAHMLVRNGHRILIPLFLPISYLGYYVSAFTVFQTMVMLARLPSEMLFVSLSRMSQSEGEEEFLSTYRTTQRYIVLFGWPLVLLAMGFARPVMGLFGADFQQAAPALRVLLVAALIHSVGELTENILMAKNRPQQASIAVTLGAAANFALNIVLIPLWGLTGAAVATCSGYAVMAAVVLGMAARTSGVRWTSLLEAGRIVKVALVGAPLVALLTLSSIGESIATRALWFLAAVAVVSGLGLLIRPWTRQDLSSLLRIRRALVARGENAS